jgi:AhpD family alkylhydroperoxidase
MKNPAMILPEVMQGMQTLSKAVKHSGVSERTVGLVELRASQINGCGVCTDMHWRLMKDAGESDERLFAVAVWRDTPYFTDAERAALALTEAVTRLSDRPDPVPEAIWAEAARHYDEHALAGLVLAIAAINLWNRLNVTTKQVASPDLVKYAEKPQWEEREVGVR